MKFVVRDDDEGKNYVVEEIDETETTDDIDENIEETEEPITDSELTADEISALKSLAASAPKLLALINTDEDVQDDETIEEETEEVIDTDEEIDEDVDENLHGKANDSKKSVGSIQKRKSTNDSLETDEVAEAWANRYKKYGGNN